MKRLILLMILCTSCGSNTTYRPSVYGHDYLNQEIIAPSHERISCGSSEFNKYASVKVKDLAKLAIVLKNAKLPRHVRIMIEVFDNEIKVIKSNQIEE